MECRKEENLKDCPCTVHETETCEYWGVCCQCIRHHLEREELPACYLPRIDLVDKPPYERRIKWFVKYKLYEKETWRK